MAKKKRYLTATLPDGYVKTIGPTAAPFTHYWRIVAHLGGGRTEVFWGHATSLREATKASSGSAFGNFPDPNRCPGAIASPRPDNTASRTIGSLAKRVTSRPSATFIFSICFCAASGPEPSLRCA